MTLPIETLPKPPPPAMGPAEATALLAYLRAATEAHDPAVSEGDRVLLCAAVAWLRRTAEAPTSPSPFDGWMVLPWRGPYLWAANEAEGEHIVGGAHESGGWIAWQPTKTRHFADGRELGDTPEERQAAARRACENALRARGAKL